MNGHFWWYASRSTGLVAWGAAAASVIWGLLLSTRSARGLAKPAWVLDLRVARPQLLDSVRKLIDRAALGAVARRVRL